MAYRGGRGGGGRFGRGFRAPRRAKEEPFELFPEIDSLEPAKYSNDEIRKYSQFVNWSQNLQNFFETSPYCYEDRSQSLEKVQNVDIERYSDKKLQTTKVKPPLWHLIKMDTDHMPEELARGDNRVAKKVRWDNGFDLNKLDFLEKLEEKYQGKEGAENEEEEEEVADEEDEGEYSDEGDYEQAEYFDDDEDDYNMAEDNDEPEYG